MNPNTEKRSKKFQSELSFYAKHPYFEEVKQLYLNNAIKSLVSAEKQLKSIKITKAGKVYKTSTRAVEKLKAVAKKDVDVKDKLFLKVDADNVNEYGAWIHKQQCYNALMSAYAKPTDFYLHTVKFYESNGQLSKDDEYQTISLEFNKNNIAKQMDKSDFITQVGSGFDWLVKYFIEEDEDRWVTIETLRFGKAKNWDTQKRLLQLFKASESNTCVYDGFVEYFKSKAEKDRNAKAILNKLVMKSATLARAYTVDDIQELAQLCKASVIIKDLVHFKDIEINICNTNKFRIEFINTRYNHLDLYKCVSTKPTEVDEFTYNKIKEESTFYVEKFGKLFTLDSVYKIVDTPFKTVFKNWKDKMNWSNLSISSDSYIYSFLESYDFNMHRFINDLPVDDSAYNEIDLKKAYYNYSNSDINPHYIGVPSGSFCCVKAPKDFTIDSYNELTKNKLIGFFEVQIINPTEKLSRLGFIQNSIHTLSSANVNLISKYCELKFINLAYAPAVHVPFTSDFLQLEGNIKYYCKAYGQFFCESTINSITIKPDANDKNYIQTLTENRAIHHSNGLYKIFFEAKKWESHRHIAYFIHSYTTTQIMEQLMKYNLDDVFGVKLDSIVLKKSADLQLTDNFDIKEAKIEKLIKNMSLSSERYVEDISNDTWEDKIDELNNKQKQKDDEEERYLQKMEKYYQSKHSAHQCHVGLCLENDKYYSDLDYGLDVEIVRVELNQTTDTPYKELPSYISNYKKSIHNDIKFDKVFTQTKELLSQRVIFIGGKGGSGKTSSILHSTNFNKDNICFTTCCWNLISEQKKSHNEIIGLSLPKLTGEMNGQKVDKYSGKNIRYIVIDEATLIDSKVIKQIIKEFWWCFIIILGDVDYDGNYYQCSVQNKVIKPNTIKNLQYIAYTKSYRFDNELNGKLDKLRCQMTNKEPNTIYQFVKKVFGDNFKNKSEVSFEDGDIGICSLKKGNFDNKTCLLDDYFIKKGAKPQYVIANTILEKNQLRGQILDEKPTHKNYIQTLFRTIHSFQGCQLSETNKIIIYLDSLFDRNLLYTALSRARRCDQIIIIDMTR